MNAELPASAVSWGAILAGATAATALALILFMLGTGLGLASISPWVDRGAGATAIGISAIAWITVTQVMSAGMGGYLAGRLRTKWVSVHADEVYFRDTAHGFLSWTVSTLVSAALIASAVGVVLGSGAKVGAAVAGGAASAWVTGTAAAGSKAVEQGSGDGSSYLIDALFRKDTGASAASSTGNAEGSNPTAEVTRIFFNSIRTGALPADDTRYVGQIVSQRTGLGPADAEKRVVDIYARTQAKLQQTETTAREAADKARKATIAASLWLFISLLAGAFAASLAATFGGRQRDL